MKTFRFVASSEQPIEPVPGIGTGIGYRFALPSTSEPMNRTGSVSLRLEMPCATLFVVLFGSAPTSTSLEYRPSPFARPTSGYYVVLETGLSAAKVGVE